MRGRPARREGPDRCRSRRRRHQAAHRPGSRDRVPDHSWLSRSRTRLPHEVHAAVFDWVLVLIAEARLIKGERIGVDASTMEANAALRNIVRRDNGEGYREMLERLARESGGPAGLGRGVHGSGNRRAREDQRA